MKPASNRAFWSKFPLSPPQLPALAQQKEAWGLQSLDRHCAEVLQPVPFAFFGTQRAIEVSQ
jgi:hypothetical protein